MPDMESTGIIIEASCINALWLRVDNLVRVQPGTGRYEPNESVQKFLNRIQILDQTPNSNWPQIRQIQS